DSAGWCYALSVDHVSRLVRNRQENKLVVLQRRQPVMGVQFKPGKLVGTVQVQRVTEGGPAHAAGLREGDEVVEAEGLKIRMAYDVVRQVLHRQPGDKFEMVVRRAAEGQKPAEKKYVLTLGGGDVIEPPAAGATVNYSVVDPKVILKTNNGNIERTDNRRYANDPDARYDQIAEQQRSAVVRLEELQTELQRRDEQIKALEAELEALKAQLKK
ncbi:MAG: PDZ domain-containing protein, partial [Pirellulales bacterium]